MLQSQFCSVFTREPEGDIPQLEPRVGQRLERLVITHECVLKALVLDVYMLGDRSHPITHIYLVGGVLLFCFGIWGMLCGL